MSRYNRKSSLLHKIVCFRGIEIDQIYDFFKTAVVFYHAQQFKPCFRMVVQSRFP